MSYLRPQSLVFHSQDRPPLLSLRESYLRPIAQIHLKGKQSQNKTAPSLDTEPVPQRQQGQQGVHLSGRSLLGVWSWSWLTIIIRELCLNRPTGRSGRAKERARPPRDNPTFSSKERNPSSFLRFHQRALFQADRLWLKNGFERHSLLWKNGTTTDPNKPLRVPGVNMKERRHFSLDWRQKEKQTIRCKQRQQAYIRSLPGPFETFAREQRKQEIWYSKQRKRLVGIE